MIGLTAGFALLLAAAPQEACAPRDTACQIERLEGRITVLERRLADQVDNATPVGALELQTEFVCEDRPTCARMARAACGEAGFTRGVPQSPMPATTRRGFYVVRVMCTG